MPTTSPPSWSTYTRSPLGAPREVDWVADPARDDLDAGRGRCPAARRREERQAVAVVVDEEQPVGVLGRIRDRRAARALVEREAGGRGPIRAGGVGGEAGTGGRQRRLVAVRVERRLPGGRTLGIQVLAQRRAERRVPGRHGRALVARPPGVRDGRRGPGRGDGDPVDPLPGVVAHVAQVQLGRSPVGTRAGTGCGTRSRRPAGCSRRGWRRAGCPETRRRLRDRRARARRSGRSDRRSSGRPGHAARRPRHSRRPPPASRPAVT